MPSTRIALSPSESFSRPSVEETSRPVELADALEPVADRVAVGDQPGGGGVDVGVAVEERRQRPEQVGLVLLVVGDQRPDGLAVEALELGRVAHVRQQQLVGAGLLVAPARRARRRPRRRWRRAAPRCRRAGGRADPRRGGCGRARTRSPDSPDSSSRRTAAATRRPVSPSGSGTSSTTSPASSSIGAAIEPGRDRPRRRARRPPAAAGASRPRSGLRGWARTTTTLPPADRSVPSSLPRAIRSSRSSICAAQDGALESWSPPPRRRARARARARPRRRSACVTSRSTAPSGVPSRVRIRSWPTGDSATRSSTVVTSSVSRISERSSAGERAATASTAAGAVDQDQARVERAGGGAQDLRQAGAGLDGVGDRGERPEIRGA